MVEKTIQWFRNNWFVWVILIAGYIAIRAFGYDLKVVNLSVSSTSTNEAIYQNNIDGFKYYMSDQGIDAKNAVSIESGIYKTKKDGIVEYKFIEKDSTLHLGIFN